MALGQVSVSWDPWKSKRRLKIFWRSAATVYFDAESISSVRDRFLGLKAWSV